MTVNYPNVFTQRKAALCLLLLFGCNGFAQEATSPDDRSPLFTTTPLDSFFDFKEDLLERTGFTWMLKYSVMGVQRTDETHDKSYTGQLDVILKQEVFDSRGVFLAYYMDVKQISGVSTSEFGNRNGNITPITDSDQVSLLRQAWYQHKFLDEKLDVTLGKTEPLLSSVENRFAFDDRRNFYVAPMSTAAAKDRIASSYGTMIGFHPTPWFSLNVSVNELDESVAGSQGPESGQFYSIARFKFLANSERWGEGNYRISLVNSERQGDFKESNGIIISIDQDISENWGAFLRYDDTEFQTASSELNQSSAVGIYNSSPFGRSRDDFGIGLFRTKSDQGGSFKENGGEMFYRLSIAEWVWTSMTVQYFDPAKASGSFINVGARIMLEF